MMVAVGVRLNTLRGNHVINSSMGRLDNIGVLANDFQVISKRSFPTQSFFLRAIRVQSVKKTHGPILLQDRLHVFSPEATCNRLDAFVHPIPFWLANMPMLSVLGQSWHLFCKGRTKEGDFLK